MLVELSKEELQTVVDGLSAAIALAMQFHEDCQESMLLRDKLELLLAE